MPRVRGRALSLSAAAALGIGCAWACLPELSVTPPADGPACGDGVITPDAGEACDPGPDASPLALSACNQCRVACGGNLPFVDPASSHCYFSLLNASEIDAAGASCETSGAHVVRFVSEAEVTFVASHAGATYWVGLKDLAAGDGTWLPSEPTNEPGWSSQCPGCFAHVDAGVADIPSIPDGGRRCVAGYVANAGAVPSWTQSLCKGVSRLTLCEREPVGTRTVACAPGACFTVAATSGAKRYVLLPSKWIAADAVQHCAVLGGTLVAFASREEREQVGDEIGNQRVIPGVNDFWIGLAAGADGAWAWDGDAGGLEPPPWGLSEPPITAAARAYVLVEAGAVDSELARAQTAAAETHYAVCELR